MTNQKTVKVRIAVAVDSEGRWSAWGHWEHTDISAAIKCFEPGDIVHLVIAELPIPPKIELVFPKEIAADVDEA